MNKTLLVNVLERLILLPGGPILLLLGGIVLWRTKGIWWLTVLAATLFYLSSIPATTKRLWSWMNIPPPIDPKTALRGQAIVVLGATRYSRAPEYGGRDDLAGLGLERVRYGAWLQRRTGLPILVSGRGYRAPGERSEARIMGEVLENEFGGRVTWLEERSHNTFENALYSAAILKPAGIERIVLVTHAYHMPRAKAAFEAMGLAVVPAPTVYFNTYEEEYAFLDWLPENRALQRNRLLLHEIVGLIWYRLVYL